MRGKTQRLPDMVCNGQRIYSDVLKRAIAVCLALVGTWVLAQSVSAQGLVGYPVDPYRGPIPDRNLLSCFNWHEPVLIWAVSQFIAFYCYVSQLLRDSSGRGIGIAYAWLIGLPAVALFYSEYQHWDFSMLGCDPHYQVARGLTVAYTLYVWVGLGMPRLNNGVSVAHCIWRICLMLALPLLIYPFACFLSGAMGFGWERPSTNFFVGAIAGFVTLLFLPFPEQDT